MTSAQRYRALATAAMIAGIPATGAVVVVHAHSAIAPLRAIIRERRGAEVFAAVRVMAAPTEADELAIAAGTELPIVREPFVDVYRDHAAALTASRRALLASSA